MPTQLSTRTTDSSDARYLLDSAKVLAECCQQNGNCWLQLVHSGYPARAEFLTVNANEVEIRVAPRDGGETLLQHAMCCVSFPYRTVFCAFLGCLVEVYPVSLQGRRVIVSLPKQVTSTNLRQSFRIPIQPDSGLEVRIRTSEGQSYGTIARDLAETGLELEFVDEEKPELTVGMSLKVELRYREEVIRRTADVRRVSDNRVGVLFQAAETDVDQRQMNRMTGVVVALQQAWLKSRLK